MNDIKATDSCGCEIKGSVFTLCDTHQEELNEKIANPPKWATQARGRK